MADTKYRFRLPNGEEYESTKTPAAIRKAYPDAMITHRVTVLDNGEAEMHVYGGAQQQTSEPEAVPEDAPIEQIEAHQGDENAKAAPKTAKVTKGR